MPADRRSRARRLASVIMVVAAVALFGPAGPAFASAGADARQVAFSGTVLASETHENVDVVGRVHLVVTLAGSPGSGWALRWLSNVEAWGTGATTGDRYRGHGTDVGTVNIPPGPPVRTAVLHPACGLIPPGPPAHPPSPCRLLVQVAFDEAGRLSAVDVHVGDGFVGTTD